MNLKKAREKAKLSRADVAKALEITERRYKSWELEERMFTLVDAANMARLFNCSVDYLSGDDNIPTPTPVLTPQATELIGNYNALNEAGQDDLVDYSGKLQYVPEYKKDSPPVMVEETA